MRGQRLIPGAPISGFNFEPIIGSCGEYCPWYLEQFERCHCRRSNESSIRVSVTFFVHSITPSSFPKSSAQAGVIDEESEVLTSTSSISILAIHSSYIKYYLTSSYYDIIS